MKVAMYSIYDSKVQTYSPPFLCGTHSAAKRTMYLSFPSDFPFRSDYSLFCIGVYDDETGLIESNSPYIIGDES